MTDNQRAGRHSAKPDDLGNRSTVNIKRFLEKDEELERQANDVRPSGRHAAPEAQPES